MTSFEHSAGQEKHTHTHLDRGLKTDIKPKPADPKLSSCFFFA